MISTYSAFNYGHTITVNNAYFPIDEGDGAINVELNVGSYSLGEFVLELSRALNAFLDNSYEVTLDRMTGRVTISSNQNFDILLGSSPLKNVSCYELVGFNGSEDLVGASEYEATVRSGFLFEPQFKLQGYVDFEDDVERSNATVNESASGIVQVSSFGELNFMSCNIKFQTNITPQNVIKNDPNGANNLRAFLKYATTKSPIEFIKDIDVPSSFTKCILESTPQSPTGTAFQMRELYSEGIADYFESGVLKFRRLG